MPRLLLTRARPQAEAFAAEVRAQTGLTVLIAPMLEMRDLPVKVDLSGVSALAFTSKNGVAAFVRRSSARLPAYCVGQATADYASALGFDTRTADGSVESLRALLPKTGVLHLHGQHVAGALGVPHIAIYEQVALPLAAEALALLANGEVEAAALFSPRSARLLAEYLPENPPKLPVFYALSPAVADPLSLFGAPRICPEPSAKAMIRLLSADYPA